MGRTTPTIPPRLTEADRSDLARSATAMLSALRAHGADRDGSVTRLVYSKEWQSAMAEIHGWFADGGLETVVDAAGNRFGKLAGDTDAVIMAGSHVDSVRRGGAYDGALGVVLAICAVTWLRQACGRPRRTLEVLAGCEEESSRFPGNFWGIRAILGLISADELERRRDAQGVTIGDAMKSCGLDPNRIATAARSDVVAFVEPHIEQGPVLESEGLDIGVVETVVGVRQLALTLRGSSGHAGTTPMEIRRDPLLAASEIALQVRAIALDIGNGAVATVGRVEVEPGGANQVPGEVRMTVDFRHSDDGKLDGMQDRLLKASQGAAERNLVQLNADVRLSQKPAAFNSRLQDVIERSCESAKCKWIRMASGAGHDAQVMARYLPAGMFFVPSRDGVSHRSDEYTDTKQIVSGIEVLIGTLFELGYGHG